MILRREKLKEMDEKSKVKSGIEGVWIQKNNFRVLSIHLVKLQVKVGWNWEYLPLYSCRKRYMIF